MKRKRLLIASIVQLLVGILTVVSFVILWCGGEKMTRWIVALILGIAFAVMGTIGLLDYQRKK